jgi:hypothetical protein
MKKKFLFSLMFLFFFLFFVRGSWLPTDVRLDTGTPLGAYNSQNPQICSSGSNVYVVWQDYRVGNHNICFNYSADWGATWQPTDIRLDTGDPPGANRSSLPQISSSESGVYVVWIDERNGEEDIYFNYSADGGATWQASDIRLNTGDTPGTHWAGYPQISSSGNNVYVVWSDQRNGNPPDIYFNYSIDKGATWQASDFRIDTGDPAGASGSWLPQISSTDNNVCVVWYDYRNGASDIYFNTASSPIPDIKANGTDGPVTIIRSDTLSITVEFDSGFLSNNEADWWLVAITPLGWYYYHPTSGWLPGREVTLQVPLRDLPSREVLDISELRAGTYTFDKHGSGLL